MSETKERTFKELLTKFASEGICHGFHSESADSARVSVMVKYLEAKQYIQWLANRDTELSDLKQHYAALVEAAEAAGGEIKEFLRCRSANRIVGNVTALDQTGAALRTALDALKKKA